MVVSNKTKIKKICFVNNFKNLCLNNLAPLYQGQFEEKCVVLRNGTEVSQMCVPKGSGSKCGEKTETTAVCCCDTSKCNNDAFVAACKVDSGSGSVSLAPMLFVTALSMVVNAVFAR